MPNDENLNTKTYIFTWNPEKWKWPSKDLEEAIAQTKKGNPYSTSWTTGKTNTVKEGSRFFLFRQHADRGIIGAGVVTSDNYQDKHWDGSDKVANHVDCDIDVLLSANERLPVETLLDNTSFKWNYMVASGWSLPPDDANIVEQLWADHIKELGLGLNKPRNPPWQRDELILALDLYFLHPPNTVSQSHPIVLELSELLNDLPIHAHRPDGEKFRNPNGVYMKLCNFLRLDPDYKGTGLTRGGKLEEQIWNKFAGDRGELHRLAEAIAHGYQAVSTDVQLEDEDENDFPEGRVLYRLHRQRERNASLIKKKKQQAESLACEVCGFDFLETYGEIGQGFIECHHTIPISQYSQGQKTNLEDLALVCANCHRMLHRRRPWPTIYNLATLMDIPGTR